MQEAVTVNARMAMGGYICEPTGPRNTARPRLRLAKGDVADFVLLHGNDTVYSAALNPSCSRTTIKNGLVVARRTESRWILPIVHGPGIS